MNAELLAAALGNAKRYKRGWLASCPVPGHGNGKGDRHPSLAITQLGEKFLFKCFGGCDQEDVFAAIKPHLPNSLNWNRPLVARDPLSGIRPIVPPTMKEVMAWDYIDENGEVTAQKVRYDVEGGGKTYRQYHLINGERVPTIRNWTPIPFGLPLMIARPMAPVFVTEGEKAAEFLVGMFDVVAISAHAGSSEWPAAITPWFHGRLVVVLPDNDRPGWKYAKRVVRDLQGVAQAIKVVDLADDESAIGDDAEEFIGRGFTFEEFARRIAEAKVVEDFEDVVPPQRLVIDEKAETEPESVVPEKEPFAEVVEAQEAQRYRVEMWRDAKDEPVKWLVDRIVPEKGFMALYGPPGTFKSFIALHLAAMIASGDSWLAHEVPNAGEVLYIAGEGHGGIGTRISGLRHAYELKDIPVGVIRSQVNLRSSDQDFADLIAAIRASEIQRPKLIIIDTLARAFGGGNENASEDMGSFISNCGRLQEATGAALLVVHHSGKDASLGLRGHSSFLGAVDTQIEITRHTDQMSGTLKVTKQKDGKDGVEIHFSMETVNFDQQETNETHETSAAKLNLGFEDDLANTLVVKPFKGDLPDGVGFRPPQNAKPNAGRGKHQSMGREALRHIVKTEGQYQIVQGERHRVVTLERWRDEVYARLGNDVEDSDRRKRWKEVKDKLVELEFAAIRNDLVWIKPINQEGF